MAITQLIADNDQGTLRLDSEPGRGIRAALLDPVLRTKDGLRRHRAIRQQLTRGDNDGPGASYLITLPKGPS